MPKSQVPVLCEYFDQTGVKLCNRTRVQSVSSKMSWVGSYTNSGDVRNRIYRKTYFVKYVLLCICPATGIAPNGISILYVRTSSVSQCPSKLLLHFENDHQTWSDLPRKIMYLGSRPCVSTIWRTIWRTIVLLRPSKLPPPPLDHWKCFLVTPSDGSCLPDGWTPSRHRERAEQICPAISWLKSCPRLATKSSRGYPKPQYQSYIAPKTLVQEVAQKLNLCERLNVFF